MCNLYTIASSLQEIARFFGATIPVATNAGAGDVYPGGQGMVIREADGARVLESMVWGWPLPQKSKKTGKPIKPKPVNNIANLATFPWRVVAPQPEKRCLIPLTGFAEAEGEKGRMTRTWFTVKDAPVFAWAGLWNDSDEWGRWYSGMMTDANKAVAPVHNRMPVLLRPDEYDRWLHGSMDDVKAFQERVFPADMIGIERTDDPWFRRRGT